MSQIQCIIRIQKFLLLALYWHICRVQVVYLILTETQETTAHMNIFMFSQAKYTRYEENWLLQDLTASIQMKG
jgi:hypothetical protein